MLLYQNDNICLSCLVRWCLIITILQHPLDNPPPPPFTRSRSAPDPLLSRHEHVHLVLLPKFYILVHPSTSLPSTTSSLPCHHHACMDKLCIYACAHAKYCITIGAQTLHGQLMITQCMYQYCMPWYTCIYTGVEAIMGTPRFLGTPCTPKWPPCRCLFHYRVLGPPIKPALHYLRSSYGRNYGLEDTEHAAIPEGAPWTSCMHAIQEDAPNDTMEYTEQAAIHPLQWKWWCRCCWHWRRQCSD